jgi:hypothetical protein
MTSRLVLLTFLDGSGGGYPDNTLPGGPPNYPSGGPVFPGGPVDPGYGQGHPRPPHIGGGPVTPPVYPSGQPIFPPVTIDNTLPEGSTPPPQISLPIVLPPTINPVPPGRNQKFELKYSVRFGWVLVAVEDETAEPK